MAILGLINVAAGEAQEINLDKMVKCGDLICYQALKDPNVFHYLPDQPRLATKNGRPQFSFLKYARTEKTGKAGTNKAEGGGIVHFLVTYGADKSQVKEAEKALQEKYPDAVIDGPIVYRKGSFALITSFKDGNTTTTKTVAVGKAPLMEGQKAAVSMALTREGAELLWESFKTDTPDISLVFDMEFVGVREPFEATLEADWARVSKHQQLKAGVKYAWFGADVDILFQELRQTGAVKITTKGKDAALEKILDSAHNKLLQVMFDPAPNDELTRAAAEKNSYSNLNQAVKMLKDSAASRSSSSRSTTRRTSLLTPDPGNVEVDVWAALMHFLTAEAYADESPSEGATTESASEAYNRARRLYEEARGAGFPPEATEEALAAYEDYQYNHNPTGSRASEVSGRIRMLSERLAAVGAATSGSSLATQSVVPSSSTAVSSGSSTASPAPATSQSAASQRSPATTTKAASSSVSRKTSAPKKSSSRRSGTAASSRSNGSPGFSLVASYKMKKIKRSGKLVYQMNHYRTEKQAFAMAENIGSLYKRYGHDPKVFRAVTIDDPVFKQREILVTLDGQDSSTFTRHLNFVTVKLKKQHQSGDLTSDEVVITPEKFNAQGNSFSLGYGYKGDDDRNRWLDYNFETLWSFHGGVEIRTPWKQTDIPMLALQPPHRYRTVTFEGDGVDLSTAGVRHAVITVTSMISGQPIKNQATIRNRGPAPALVLDIPEDPANPDIQVSITWHLSGGKNIAAPGRALEGNIVYWDELPKGGA